MKKGFKIVIVVLCVLLIAAIAATLFFVKLAQERQAVVEAKKAEIVALCMPAFSVAYSNADAYAPAATNVKTAQTILEAYEIETETTKILVRDARAHLEALTENPLLNYDEAALAAVVSDVLAGQNGNWSYCIKIPGTAFYVEQNNRPMQAASTIKLFNMVTLFDEIEKGNLTMDGATEARMEAMITVSSNPDSNEIVRTIGKGNFAAGAKKVTEYAHALGCADTQEEHMLYDEKVLTPGENLTSVRDCADVLEKLYLGKCVSKAADAQMLEILKKQTRRFKIPMGLPKGTVVANKTGENSKVELDVGIIYAPKCDYILCIGVTEFGNTAVRKTISEVSEAVYAYFNA